MHLLVWMELKEMEARAMDSGYSGAGGGSQGASLLGPSSGAGTIRTQSSGTIHELGPAAPYPKMKSRTN